MRGRRTGIGLAEVLVTIGLFGFVTAAIFLMLSRGHEMWRRDSGSHTATLALNTSLRSLEQDLLQGPAQPSVTTVAAHLSGGGSDGQAVWTLSARAVDGSFTKTDDGYPFWQRNVLYYLVVPLNHQTLFGLNCAGGADPSGFDDRCPHKMLIRKVIDSGPATDPSGDPETVAESLLDDVSPYLTQPAGWDTSAMAAESGLESVEIVAGGLLRFEARPLPGGIVVDLRATALDQARRELTVGATALGEHPLTAALLKPIYPRN